MEGDRVTSLTKKNHQEGIVLVTTLLVLAVVSLLVASMILTSGSEEKMAFNAQTRNQTFQAADSALSAIINDDNAMFDAIDDVNSLSSVETFDLGIPRLNSESFLEYQGKGIPVGASLSSAVTFKFEAEGRGYIDDNNTFDDADDEAKSRIFQGMYRISYVAE